ncbi:MAG TPA: histidine kinase dimerization/phospho-acceptor domain-containing protein, partial [Oscillatoriaceae cyanobacterium]
MSQEETSRDLNLADDGYVERLEAERDALRRQLGEIERRMAQAESDLTSSQSREEGGRVDLWQRSQELKTANETIDRQTISLAGQRGSIDKLTGELAASTGREERLQSDYDANLLELQEKDRLLAWVLESTVDGVLVYRSVQGDDGKVVDFECVLNNPAARRLYGVDRLTGKRLLDLHPDLRSLGLWEHYLQVIETGKPYEGEYQYSRNGKTRWFRVLAIKVANSLATTFSDITQRKEMEAEIVRNLESLKQADRMKSQFLNVISHELRTPLNGILGFLSILADELVGPLNPAQKDYLHKAEECSERLLALISNLLDLNRMQAGRFSVDVRPAKLAPIVAEVLATMGAKAQARTVVNQVSGTLPRVLADEGRVAQVLNILLDNAVKFSGEGATIVLRAAVSGDFV